MPQIRQELNIMNAGSSAGFIVQVTGANDDSEKVQLDTSKYVSPTYYFEIDALIASGSENVTLRRVGTTTDDATIAVTGSTTSKRFRSASFTPPAGATEYMIHCASTNAAVRAARIIVIDNATTLTKTQTQIDIGGRGQTAYTNTAASALTDPKYWLYTAANWNAVNTFSAEVVYKTASSNTATIVLQEDNGAFSFSDKTTIVSASNTGITRTRVTFTPGDGRHYRITVKSSTTKSSVTIYNARIIVDQTPSNTVSYYFDAHAGGPTDPNSVWTNDANAFDGSTSTHADGSTAGSTSSNYLYGQGTSGTGSAPADANGSSINSVQVRIYAQDAFKNTLSAAVYTASLGTLLGTGQTTISASPQWGPYTTLSAPSGGWTWAAIQTLEVKLYNNVNITTTTVYRVEIQVNYPSTGNILGLEPQYLLLNATDIGTGQQGFIMLWDSTEWSSVNNTYYHAIDSDNASNSAKLQDIDNSNTDVTNSTVTGSNQQISSALTMPTSGHQLDVNVTNSTGTVASSRIIVVAIITGTTTTSITKSLKYTVIASASKTKSLKYTIKTTSSAITKSLRYAIGVHTPITKSLQYAIKKSISSLTKALQYEMTWFGNHSSAGVTTGGLTEIVGV